MKLILDVENTTTKRDGKLHLDPFEPDNSLTMVGVVKADDWDNVTYTYVFNHVEKKILKLVLK